MVEKKEKFFFFYDQKKIAKINQEVFEKKKGRDQVSIF
jgi:hypothetical protein